MKNRIEDTLTNLAYKWLDKSNGKYLKYEDFITDYYVERIDSITDNLQEDGEDWNCMIR